MSDMSDANPTVIGLVTQGLTEVKEAVSQLSRDLHSTLSRLPNEYVPRRELERRLDEFAIDVAAERAERLAAVKALEEATAEAERKRVSARRWLVGLSTGSGISLAGVLSGIYLHFS